MGSLSKSLPLNHEKIPTQSTPKAPLGMVIFSKSTYPSKPCICVTFGAKSIAVRLTTATLTGEQIIPIWLAMLAPAIGRSGRMPFLMAIS